MNRFKIYDLRFKILLIFLLLFINHKSLFINHAFAAESSPSSDIKTKLQELQKEIASKAAKLKLEINKKLKDKAYIGQIKQKSETGITLASSTGPKIVTINQDTEFESRVKNKKFSRKSLTEEDYVASLGDVDETGVLTAKKIILLPAPDKAKTFLWGQIISNSGNSVTLKEKSLKTINISLPKSTSVNINDFVILTGTKNDIFEAGFVYVIPQGGILRSKKIATPSAQVATKSASPSAKKK